MAFKFNIDPNNLFNPYEELRNISNGVKKIYKKNTPPMFQNIVQYIYLTCAVFTLTMLGSLFNTIYLSPIQDSQHTKTSDVYESIAMYALLVLILFFIFKALYPDKTKHLFLDKWQHKFLRSGLIYAFIIIVATTLWSLFATNVLGVSATSTNQNVLKTYLQSNTSSAIWFLLITILFGPIFEEIVYRKLAIGSLHAPKSHIYTRALLSILVFTILHIWLEFSQMIIQPSYEHLITLVAHVMPYLIIAISFTYIYLKQRSLWASISLHVINNLIAICFMFL